VSTDILFPVVHADVSLTPEYVEADCDNKVRVYLAYRNTIAVQVRAKRKNTRMHATAHITVAVAEAMIAALKKAIAENRE
jgi:hypothetical protein